MATAEISISESLTRNQKAIQRTNERRAHVQALRAQIQYILDEYRWAKKILNAEMQEKLDEILVTSESEPERPARHHGKAPTTLALYYYLTAHAEWEYRTGHLARQELKTGYEQLKQALLAETLEQIHQATEAAIAQVPTMKTLQRQLYRMGAEACTKLRPVVDTPLVGSGMLNDYGLEARLAYARSIRTVDGGRPQLTAPDSDIAFDEGPDTLTSHRNGHQISTSTPTVAAREIMFQH